MTPEPAPAPVETSAPAATTAPSEPPPPVIDLVQLVPEQWQIIAVALALLVFALGILIAAKI